MRGRKICTALICVLSILAIAFTSVVFNMSNTQTANQVNITKNLAPDELFAGRQTGNKAKFKLGDDWKTWGWNRYLKNGYNNNNIFCAQLNGRLSRWENNNIYNEYYWEEDAPIFYKENDASYKTSFKKIDWILNNI